MKVKQLFEKYDVMPQLSEHQLRVGAVGQMVAENWRGGCDVEMVTKVCLLHDMGNIVKFDLSDEAQRNRMFGQVDDLANWRKVQEKYWEKYGRDAHAATKGILADAGLASLNKYIDEEGELYFSEALGPQLEKANTESVILMYADFRVKPEGVVGYRERVDDLRDRYGGGKSPTWYEWTGKFGKYIEGKTKIDPESITEQDARGRWDELLSVTI